jgi:hypothetical protein
MTPYQLGYATGLRCQIARAPRLPSAADVARWRSGLRDAWAHRTGLQRNADRTRATFGAMIQPGA